MYNNYFLQVQTLINQKAIGTGSTQKEERHKESMPVQKGEIKITPEKRNPWEEKETTIEKVCKYCNQPFLARNPKNEYCSPAHRKAYFREQKKNESSG